MSNVIKFDLPPSTPTEVAIQQRSKYVERILLNHCREHVNILSVFSCFLGIMLGIVFTFYNTMFPKHHPIGNPMYWYEPMLANLVGWIPIAAVFWSMSVISVLRLREEIRLNFVRLLMVLAQQPPFSLPLYLILPGSTLRKWCILCLLQVISLQLYHGIRWF